MGKYLHSFIDVPARDKRLDQNCARNFNPNPVQALPWTQPRRTQ